MTLVWCLALVVGLLAAGSAGARPASSRWSSAVAMLGADGYTSWYADDPTHAAVASATWARARSGYELASSGPEALGWWAVTSHVDVGTADLARFSWAGGSTSSGGSKGDEVFSLVNGDVRAEVVAEGRSALLYTGGLLVLPADVGPGRTWDSSGQVTSFTDGMPGGTVQYTARGSAVTPSDAALASQGCLDVTVTRTAEGAENTERRTWCPGRGMVRFTVDGTTYSVAEPPAATEVPMGPTFDWTRTDGATATTRTLVPRGGSLLTLTYVSRPGVLPNGTLVTALKQGNDVVAIDPVATTGSQDRTVWRAHPGGVILTSVTLGEVTVVTTSERRVVAYGPTGVALWAAATPDSVNQPARVFGGRVLVASVDGSVTALDAATGRAVWRMKMPSELLLQPVSSGDTLVVIDENGTTVALGTDGHEVWRSSEYPAGAYTVAGGVLVVNERGASTLRGYDLASGTKLWRTWEPDLMRSLSDLGGVVLAYTPHGAKAFDPTTGAVLWTVAEEALDLIVVSDRVVLATTSDLVVLDPAGAESIRIPHHLSRLPASSVYLAAGPGSLVAATSTQLFTEVL